MDRMQEDVQQVESMMDEWHSMMADMDTETRGKMEEAMRHMHTGIDMMKNMM